MTSIHPQDVTLRRNEDQGADSLAVTTPDGELTDAQLALVVGGSQSQILLPW
jgi:hypothetical protein